MPINRGGYAAGHEPSSQGVRDAPAAPVPAHKPPVRIEQAIEPCEHCKSTQVLSDGLRGHQFFCPDYVRPEPTDEQLTLQPSFRKPIT